MTDLAQLRFAAPAFCIVWVDGADLWADDPVAAAWWQRVAAAYERLEGNPLVIVGDSKGTW